MQLPAKAVPEAASRPCSEEAKELSTTDALRIASLKGPTMGLVNLLSMKEDGTASMDYDLQLYGAADEIVPLLMKDELDHRLPSRQIWPLPCIRRRRAAFRL